MKKQIIKRKERIMITAIEVLNECGIYGRTIKEIAKRKVYQNLLFTGILMGREKLLKKFLEDIL